jgi:hypothetical protein
MAPRTVFEKEGHAALRSLRGYAHALDLQPCVHVRCEADGGTNQMPCLEMAYIFDSISLIWAAGIVTGVIWPVQHFQASAVLLNPKGRISCTH